MEEDKNSNDEYERRIRFIHGLSPYWNKPGIYVKYDKENQEFLNKMKKFKGSFSNEYGIGKSIKSINASQFKIEV